MTSEADIDQNPKPNIWARRRSRHALVQAVYQWHMTGHELHTLLADFEASPALKKADTLFFKELLALVLHKTAELDAALAPYLDRAADRLDPIERCILRLACAELTGRIEIPYRVVIDEYVEQAKTFGAQDAHKYINGVLDKLAGTARPLETAHHRSE